MKIKNYVMYGDAETLARHKAEADYIGRPCELVTDDEGNSRLIVFALPQKKVQAKKAKRAPRGR